MYHFVSALQMRNIHGYHCVLPAQRIRYYYSCMLTCTRFTVKHLLLIDNAIYAYRIIYLSLYAIGLLAYSI